MSGEFAVSEWRVAVFSVALVSICVGSTFVHAPHLLFDLPYYGEHPFPGVKPSKKPTLRGDFLCDA